MERQFVSFPKSGRTWVRYALSLLGLDKQIRFHHDGLSYNDGSKPPLDLDVAKRIARYKGATRVVYLTRNPRDVMVSLYFQVIGRFRDFFHYSGTLSEFIRDDYFGAKNLKNFDDQWRDLCRRDVALLVTYEQCHANFESALHKILARFEFSLDDDVVKAASTGADIEKMRTIEVAGDFEQPWLRLRNESPKVRRGVVGGYRDYLSPEDQQFLDDVFGPYDGGILPG